MLRRLSLTWAACLAATTPQAALAEVLLSGSVPDEVFSVATNFHVAPWRSVDDAAEVSVDLFARPPGSELPTRLTAPVPARTSLVSQQVGSLDVRLLESSTVGVVLLGGCLLFSAFGPLRTIECCRRVLLPIVVTAVFVSAFSSLRAQYQLNPPLARGDTVRRFEISPDGQWLAMEIGWTRSSNLIDNPTHDGLSEVFVGRIFDAEVLSLGVGSGLQPRHGNRAFGPDSAHLITTTKDDLDQPFGAVVHALESGERYDLYARPAIDGSPVEVQFSPAFPESDWVLLQTQREAGRTTYPLYALDAFGSSATQLAESLPLVRSYQLVSQAGQDVAFFASASDATQSDWRLFRVDLATGERVALTSDLFAGTRILQNFDWRLTAGGQRIVYSAPQLTTGITELFTVPAAGGEPQRISVPVTADADVEHFELANNRAVYSVGRVLDPAPAPRFLGYSALFSVPIDGGPSIPLFAQTDADPNARIGSFRVSPNGEYVVFTQYENSQHSLQLAKSDGSHTVELASAPGLFHSNLNRIVFSPDHEALLYPGSRDGIAEWWITTLDGGRTSSLTASLPDNLNISAGVPQFTPDGREVVLYLHDERHATVIGAPRELFLISVAGGKPIRINEDLAVGGYIDQFEITPDGSTLIYTATQHNRYIHELFAAPLRLHWARNAVGVWNVAGNWGPNPDETNPFMPLRPTTVFIGAGGEVTVPGGVSIASLILGSEEADESTLRFESPRFIGGGHGLSISRDAEVRPSGRLALVHGRMDVEGTFVNRGTIDVIGGDPHSVPSGVLRAPEIMNGPEASILVGEHNYLNLSGTLENRGAITLAPSASLRFDGIWGGRGTLGTGTTTIEGSLMPGDGIGAQAFGGDLHLESRSRVAPSRLVIDVAGPRAVQQHDVLLVGGMFTIDAALDVQLDPQTYQPSAGDAFTIVEASEGIYGSFSQVLVPSPDWSILYDDTSIRLLVLDPAGRGDYNGDGRIDQVDLDLVLTSWGRGVTNYWPLPPTWTHYLPVGTVDQNQLDAVLSDWGRLIESGAVAPAHIADQAVPEPSTMSLLILSVALAICSVRRRSRSSQSPR